MAVFDRGLQKRATGGKPELMKLITWSLFVIGMFCKGNGQDSKAAGLLLIFPFLALGKIGYKTATTRIQKHTSK